ncbi:MAG: zinc dependent phospholipase C family protein [Chloroflexi bacterium]|nr:zinc dependent phospholipase C family protein [Chloroflexota bacterium]
MPNLPMHIYLADQVAKRLDWDWVNDHRGSLYLGSTAPDIRIMTKWPRERTHFAPLSVDEVGAGTRQMFKLHPELEDRDAASDPTKAFLVGYISHLVADEAWITNVYRPNFDPPPGQCMVARDKVEANLWDRALQLEMDRAAADKMTGLLPDGEVLADADLGVQVAFLEPGALQEWREWVLRFLGWDLTWERLKRALNRMYRDDENVQRVVDTFIEEMPASMERIYEKISREKIDAYRQRALEDTLTQVHQRWGQLDRQ